MQFQIRPFQKQDFETLWQIDQVCFDPELAYSRPELAVYMRRPGSFTLVAESCAESGPAPTPGGKCHGATGAAKDHGSTGVPARLANKMASIIGFIVAEAGRRSGHIITIDVLPEHRRWGVGSALLEAAERQLQQSGVKIVELETPVDNAGAIQFYKRKGYFVEKTVPGYYSNHLDALVMRKQLLALSL